LMTYSRSRIPEEMQINHSLALSEHRKASPGPTEPTAVKNKREKEEEEEEEEAEGGENKARGKEKPEGKKKGRKG
jgi:hypothetical protein